MSASVLKDAFVAQIDSVESGTTRSQLMATAACPLRKTLSIVFPIATVGCTLMAISSDDKHRTQQSS
jgi:hypothetical protein